MSDHKPSNSDSDIVKPCMSGITIKKRKVISTHIKNQGKIISDRESCYSNDNEYDLSSNRGPQPLASTPVSNDDVNNTLELSRTISPVAKCKLNTSVTPEKPKYTKKSRVKPLNKEKWENVSRKIKRNRGEAYEYKVKGNKNLIKKVEARKLGPPCDCKKKCYEMLGQEACNATFHDFWELGDYNLQNSDLQNKIVKEEIKRSRPKKS